MPTPKDLVEQYFEGFRLSNHFMVLECLTDDVVWDLKGFKHVVGKEAFDQEIESEEFTGSPSLTLLRLVEEDDTVVAIGSGESTHVTGNVHRFAFCDVFTLRDNLVCRVESYVVPLEDEASY